MPAGMNSGKIYAVLSAEQYKQYVPKMEGSIQLAYINTWHRTTLKDMKVMTSDIRALKGMIRKHKRGDTITFVTYRPVIWEWMTQLVIDDIIEHSVFITDRGHYNFDEVVPLPVTEILYEINDVRDFVMVNRLPNKTNIVSSIMTDCAKVHWALGGLSTSGRPDICLYVNLQSLSPDPRGASV